MHRSSVLMVSCLLLALKNVLDKASFANEQKK